MHYQYSNGMLANLMDFASPVRVQPISKQPLTAIDKRDTCRRRADTTAIVMAAS